MYFLFSKIFIYHRKAVLLYRETLKTINTMVNQKLVHRIVSTSFGEVMLYGGFNYSTQEPFCDMYIGDNFDDFIGSVDNCSIYDSEDNILSKVENALG